MAGGWCGSWNVHRVMTFLSCLPAITTSLLSCTCLTPGFSLGWDLASTCICLLNLISVSDPSLTCCGTYLGLDGECFISFWWWESLDSHTVMLLGRPLSTATLLCGHFLLLELEKVWVWFQLLQLFTFRFHNVGLECFIVCDLGLWLFSLFSEDGRCPFCIFSC